MHSTLFVLSILKIPLQYPKAQHHTKCDAGPFFAIPVHSCATKIELVFIEDLMPKSTFGMKAYYELYLFRWAGVFPPAHQPRTVSRRHGAVCTAR